MSIAACLAEVNAKIAHACRSAGRSVAEVQLVAVSKTIPAERCLEAVAAGQLTLGENYAQELRDKAATVAGARWHFVGPLQRNKVKYVVGTAALIHSVDSLRLAEEIAKRATQAQLIQDCLIEVNVGDETQKSGVGISALPALLDGVRALPSLRCEGLMCIPPADGDPRRHFAALQQLAAMHRLPQLSMGMSADYELAIAHGATLVRVGTAIFGTRA